MTIETFEERAKVNVTLKCNFKLIQIYFSKLSKVLEANEFSLLL